MSLHRALAAAALLVTSLAASARAQEGEGAELPMDVASDWAAAAGERPELPAPPDDYATDRVGTVTWTYPRAAESDAEELMAAFAEAWTAITVELGAAVDSDMVIRIGRNPDEMAALAPVGHPPPPYATGVAYPAFGVVLLTLTAPTTWRRPPMEAVLRSRAGSSRAWPSTRPASTRSRGRARSGKRPSPATSSRSTSCRTASPSARTR